MKAQMRALNMTWGLVVAFLHLTSLLYIDAQFQQPLIGFLALPASVCFWKCTTIMCAIGATFFGGRFILAALLAHSVLAYHDYSLFPSSWNFLSHLIYFGAALSFYEIMRNYSPNRAREAASLAVAFMMLTVGLIYFQAFLAKLSHSGWDWFLTGNTVKHYVAVHGTSLGRWLADHEWFGPASGMGTLMFEAGFLPAIALCRNRDLRWLAFAGMSFHIGIWMTMDISFWHLWFFYPALFRSNPHAD